MSPHFILFLVLLVFGGVAMAEGQYYYRAYTTDTDGRASAGRSDTVPFVVRRVAPPSPPPALRLG